MNSNDQSDPLDLERGPPTTERDIKALRALRYSKMTDAEYERFLAALTPPDSESLRAKCGPHGAPFSV